MTYVTRLASLDDYEKGGVDVIDDDPKNYAFSNIFEVASRAKPFEQIAVGKNFEYVLEVVRVEGVSGWRACAHDQSALVLDGEVEFTLRTLNDAQSLPRGGSAGVAEESAGAAMGRVVARRGHLTLLPAGRAYRYASGRPAVLLIQTVEGVDTQYRWAEICQTA
ncbi:MAG: hypothetical protein ACXVW7_04245 [Trebonia sp.]